MLSLHRPPAALLATLLGSWLSDPLPLWLRPQAFTGAEFEVVQHGMTATAVAEYNAAARFWQQLFRHIGHAVTLCHTGPDGEFEQSDGETDDEDELVEEEDEDAPRGKKKGTKPWHVSSGHESPAAHAKHRAKAMATPLSTTPARPLAVAPSDSLHCPSINRQVMRSFWAAHQRFFRAFCTAAKVPVTIDLAKKALAACLPDINAQETNASAPPLAPAPTAPTN